MQATLIGSFGNDETIVESARVSYGDGTKKHSDTRGLIRYLLRHRHTTPFEMVVFRFYIQVPIFVARQWHRHRMASINEESARYSVMKDEFYYPPMRAALVGKGQGSSDEVVEDVNMEPILEHHREGYEIYQKLLSMGVAREVARTILPVSMMTSFYWKSDLWNLMNFLRLRYDSHAQKEIHDLAKSMYEQVKEVCPIAMEAFDDYIRLGYNLSRMEVECLRKMLLGLDLDYSSMTKREIEDFQKRFF
jgi:thymidylate synthase (FAD)